MFKVFDIDKEFKVKILVVASEANLESEKGRYLDKMVERIQKMFPKAQSLIDLVGFVITKSSEGDLDENDCDTPILK